MTGLRELLMLVAGVALLAGATIQFGHDPYEIPHIVKPAAAKDVLGSDRWSYRHRGSAAGMNKATTMWQIERAGNGEAGAGDDGSLSSGTSGAAGSSGGGGGTAISNYSNIEIFFAEDSQGNVIISSEQDSVGDQTTRSTDTTNFIENVETGMPSDTPP